MRPWLLLTALVATLAVSACELPREEGAPVRENPQSPRSSLPRACPVGEMAC